MRTRRSRPQGRPVDRRNAAYSSSAATSSARVASNKKGFTGHMVGRPCLTARAIPCTFLGTYLRFSEADLAATVAAAALAAGAARPAALGSNAVSQARPDGKCGRLPVYFLGR